MAVGSFMQWKCGHLLYPYEGPCIICQPVPNRYQLGETKKLKIYISGAISNIDYAVAFAAFDAAETRLAEMGHVPVNPMKKVGPTEGKTWEEYMKEDIPIMLECDGIFMLRGFENSRGAMLELYVAATVGMQVIYG